MNRMMKKGMVMLPISKFEMNDGEGDVSPQEGDSVELTGTVQMVENGIAHVMVENAMVDENQDQAEDRAESEDSNSEEDKMMELAKKSDEENYS